MSPAKEAPPAEELEVVDVTVQADAKKPKMAVPESPDGEWPEAWVLPETVEEPCAPNRQEPNQPVGADGLRQLGIAYWKMDADAFSYPVREVPWDPKDAADPRLMAIRDDRGYNYADIITVHPDHLPEFDEKIKSFFEEHLHTDEEVRYILGGSGYFDVRDLNDKWVRIHVNKGDLITLPEGIYHRFTCDSGRLCHAMRLFKGEPVWTPLNRPQEDHPARKRYLEEFASSAEEKKE